MEVELWQRPPTRRAEVCLPPNHPPQHAGCVFTRDGSCVGMTWPVWTPCAGCTQHSGAAPNREHDFASRTVDLFRAVTLAHRHALNPNGPRAQAVDGRIMSVLKQHLHVTQRDTQHLTAHGHPLTYWSTNPIDGVWGPNRPIPVPWKAHQSPSHHRQRAEAGGPLPSCSR
jgi:hypothetical protein